MEAIDLDTGATIILPEAETVDIEVLPLADGNKVIPATLRSLGGYRIRKLKRIDGADPANGEPYPYAILECDPYPRWGGDNPAHWNTTCVCCIRNEQDAFDPLFAPLTARERARIVAAVAT